MKKFIFICIATLFFVLANANATNKVVATSTDSDIGYCITTTYNNIYTDFSFSITPVSGNCSCYYIDVGKTYNYNINNTIKTKTYANYKYLNIQKFYTGNC